MYVFRCCLLTLTILCITACATQRIQATTTDALVVCEASSSAMLSKGYGLQLVFMNRATGQAYRTKSRTKLSPIAFAVLPAGDYFVVDLRLPIGSLLFRNATMEMSEHFGSISVAQGEAYYLGSFRGKQKVGFRNTVSLVVIDTTPTAKFQDVLIKDGSALQAAVFKYVGPPVGEELLVY